MLTVHIFLYHIGYVTNHKKPLPWGVVTNNTDCHDITEILWKMMLNTYNRTLPIKMSLTIQ